MHFSSFHAIVIAMRTVSLTGRISDNDFERITKESDFLGNIYKKKRDRVAEMHAF